MKKVYLSGPMTGIEGLNRQQFMQAQEEWIEKGYEVINPIKISDKNPGLKYNQIIGIDLKELSECESIALLPGWEKSRGCQIEVFDAYMMGLSFFDAITKKPIDLLPVIKFYVKVN
jgi:hypothetical protein